MTLVRVGYYLFLPIINSRFVGAITPLSQSPHESSLGRSRGGSFGDERERFDRTNSDGVLLTRAASTGSDSTAEYCIEPQHPDPSTHHDFPVRTNRSRSPPPLSIEEAVSRAVSLSKKLSGSNIPAHVTDTGDLWLDMTGYKSNEEDALRAEVMARKILAEELEGNYDIGALIGADEHGNLWIYSSEEAREAANRRATFNSMRPSSAMSDHAISDPGYHSDHSVSDTGLGIRHHRTQSDVQAGFPTPPQTPPHDSLAELNRNYAKTLRLTSDQLKALDLQPGANTMSFSVNKATCTATMYLWSGSTPIVISDIDGTITK